MVAHRQEGFVQHVTASVAGEGGFPAARSLCSLVLTVRVRTVSGEGKSGGEEGGQAQALKLCRAAGSPSNSRASRMRFSLRQ